MIGREAGRGYHTSQSLDEFSPSLRPNLPASHIVGDAAIALQYEPAGQLTHAVMPGSAWYFPASQMAQLASLLEGLNLPGGQGDSSALPSGHSTPARHQEHCAASVSPGWLPKVPTGQGVLLEAPFGQ